MGGQFQIVGKRPNGGPRFAESCRACRSGKSADLAESVLGARETQPPAHEPPVEGLLKERKAQSELKTLKAERERLLETLEDMSTRQDVLNGLMDFRPLPVERREKTSGLREATPLILGSDWHVEELIEAEKVNDLNEFSLEIADQRLERMSDGIEWLVDMYRQKFVIRDLILWLGGDLMSGYIHEDTKEMAQLSPVETLLWLQQRVVRAVDRLLQDSKLERILIPCSRGNHGRSTDKIRIAAGAENSFEWLLYQHLALWYKDEPRVEIYAPKSELIYVQTYDFVNRFTHGDSISFGGGVGGLTVPLNKRIARWDIGTRADMTYIGHFHQYMSLPHAVANGSLCGYGPYSMRIGAAYEPPRQAFLLMDSKHGPCCQTPIWLD